MNPTDFSPFEGTIGGALIGASAILLMATAGRIAGASTIFGGILTMQFDDNAKWRAIFILGLVLGAAFAGLFWFDPSTIRFPAGNVMTAISGLIVGIGVTLGSGCTSGHGICGLSRFSLRSLVATITFMLVAILTVFITRHVIGA